MSTMSSIAAVRTSILVGPETEKGDATIASLSTRRSNCPLVDKVPDLEDKVGNLDLSFGGMIV